MPVPPRPPKAEQMRTRGPHAPRNGPWQAELGHWGHTSSTVGEELPGLQLLVPRTDTASLATAGPEAGKPGEPRGQASSAWGSITGAADAWGTVKGQRRRLEEEVGYGREHEGTPTPRCGTSALLGGGPHRHRFWGCFTLPGSCCSQETVPLGLTMPSLPWSVLNQSDSVTMVSPVLGARTPLPEADSSQ